MTTPRSRWPRLSRLLGGLAATFALLAIYSLLTLPPPTVGNPVVIEDALSPPTTTTTTPVSTPSSPAPSSTVQQSSVIAPNPKSRLEDLAMTESVWPVRLIIDSIDVDAPVTAGGVDARTGQMEVPRNVQDVAWYRHGPVPGEPGSSVLAAHVDLASHGPGVFFNLSRLQPGDVISVTYADGTDRTFRVEARTVYEKAELPIDVIFSRGGAPVLTLVTCGGGFNTTAQSYDSNVVVYAVPIDQPDAAS